METFCMLCVYIKNKQILHHLQRVMQNCID
nr:MAG TPA: hypothetical protein [Caudoviricetes sp.]